jgi:hypothetical protein
MQRGNTWGKERRQKTEKQILRSVVAHPEERGAKKKPAATLTQNDSATLSA